MIQDDAKKNASQKIVDLTKTYLDENENLKKFYTTW